MGRVWSGSGQTRTRTLFFFFWIQTRIRTLRVQNFQTRTRTLRVWQGLGSLMGLIQSLFDLSKLNLFRVFLYFCKQLIILLLILVRVHEIQIYTQHIVLFERLITFIHIMKSKQILQKELNIYNIHTFIHIRTEYIHIPRYSQIYQEININTQI